MSGGISEVPQDCPMLMNRIYCLRVRGTVVRLVSCTDQGARGMVPAPQVEGSHHSIVACPPLCVPFGVNDDRREGSADLQRRRDERTEKAEIARAHGGG